MYYAIRNVLFYLCDFFLIIIFQKAFFFYFSLIGRGKGGKVYGKETSTRQRTFLMTDIKFGKYKACYAKFSK